MLGHSLDRSYQPAVDDDDGDDEVAIAGDDSDVDGEDDRDDDDDDDGVDEGSRACIRLMPFVVVVMMMSG